MNTETSQRIRQKVDPQAIETYNKTGVRPLHNAKNDF
jgi:hypothetical protein